MDFVWLLIGLFTSDGDITFGQFQGGPIDRTKPNPESSTAAILE